MKKLGIKKTSSIPPGMVHRGHFESVKPVSLDFGWDRLGGPIDRYYVEDFMKKQSSYVQGRALEIGDNEYTLKFASDPAIISEILHVDASNKKATYVGDLSNAPHVPSDHFDCIILTQTLHLIYDFMGAIDTCYRILKPGGVFLFTSPGITPIDHKEWKDIWYWSFTEASVGRMMKERFGESNVKTETWGNVAVASAFLYGLGLADLSKKELDHQDPYYPVTITAVCQKQK